MISQTPGLVKEARERGEREERERRERGNETAQGEGGGEGHAITSALCVFVVRGRGTTSTD